MSAPPLLGERVVLTRAAHQSTAWQQIFEEAGAEVHLLPLIEIRPPEDPRPLEQAAAAIASFDWLVLTSTNTVVSFLPKIEPATAPRIAVVGPATAKAVRTLGFKVALEAKRSQAEGLVELLGPKVAGQRVLVPQAGDARPILVDGLRKAGAITTSPIAYRKRLPRQSQEQLNNILADPRLFWVALTSPRIARQFLKLMEDRRNAKYRVLSIGPVTSAALRDLGIQPDAEASEPTAEAMVASMISLTEQNHEAGS